MANINAKKCDLCGYVYEPFQGDMRIEVTINGKLCSDLCPKCYNSFRDSIAFLTKPRREYAPKAKKEIMDIYEFEKAR